MLSRFTTFAMTLALPGLFLLGQPAMAEVRPFTLKFAAQNQTGHPQVQVYRPQ